MRAKRRDILFFAVFGFVVLTAWIWLALGSAPTLAALSQSLHDGFHRRGDGGGLSAELLRNASQAAHGAKPTWQSLFDYLFSFFNLALGIFLLKLRPFDVTARLLSIGMVGTAVAFNLQGHDAFQVVPVSTLSLVNSWHTWIHIASGLCYMFALLLFPGGRLLSQRNEQRFQRLPLLIVLAIFFTLLSLMTVDDHTLGLVVVYGLFIPAAGVTAQVRRFRRAPDEEQRQQSKVLLFALVLALLIALPLLTLTQGPAGDTQKTVAYELTAPAPGTYFFRCDPHPEDMKGTVVVAQRGTGSDVIELVAEKNRFDKQAIILEAGARSEIRFTNLDSDLHNVAIYESAAATDPLFIGAEFSGHETAALAFRVFRIVFVVIPIALFVGLMRFRLWEIDRVINRTLVYGALAGFITLVYLGVVVGLGTAIGAGRRLNLFLSIAVTAVLAAAFQPLRERARKLANRLVYGRRATPYEVLTDFSERVGNAYALEEVIPLMAKSLGEGTGARTADVWLRVKNHLVLSASWPRLPAGEMSVVALRDESLPAFPETDRAVAVRHRGELLGALTLTKPPGRRLTPVEERLLEDVAAQAGLVLRNAQLTAELHDHLQQLRESRQRIVAAQDVERRRLERNIHDGAQQHLVALSMKLRMAQDLTHKDPARAGELLQELQADTGDALQTLRDLARGIYPPVLADRGLVAALDAHARRCPVEVRIEDTAIVRYSSETEAAVYFCCLEAIQNAVKHSEGPIQVALAASEGRLSFEVSDVGVGFDPAAAPAGTGLQNMGDRVAALGGTLEIVSAPGQGTRVRGDVPVT